MAETARRLGRPFMPWQRHVEDVAGEVLDDGRMAYPLVVCIVPRRAGKTLATVARSIQRCTIAPETRSWYTAQTGGDAGTTFREEWVPLVKRSPLGTAIRPRLSNGQESMSLPNQSRLALFAPTETALHGQDGDHVVVDEAWSFSDMKGTMLEAAMRPAMLTRRRRQLWIVSAGGTDESTWLLRYRELGRTLAAKPDQGMAYFEWHPEVDALGNITEDLDDPAVLARVHPAVGFTVELDALLADKATMREDVFRRSYLNVFQSALGEQWALFPESPWRASTATSAKVDPALPIVCGFDVAMDYSHGSIVLAQATTAGHAVELIERRAGDAWLVDRLAEIQRTYGCPLVANSHGPVRSTSRDLRDLGVTVEELTEREFIDASGELLRDVNLGALAHRPDPDLDAAAAGAGKRVLGDGWALTRKGSQGDVSPIVACAVAVHHARHAATGAVLIQVGATAA